MLPEHGGPVDTTPVQVRRSGQAQTEVPGSSQGTWCCADRACVVPPDRASLYDVSTMDQTFRVETMMQVLRHVFGREES